MLDTVRDAPAGQILRLLTGNRILKYPEEKDDFVLPEKFRGVDEKARHTQHVSSPAPSERLSSENGQDTDVEATANPDSNKEEAALGGLVGDDGDEAADGDRTGNDSTKVTKISSVTDQNLSAFLVVDWYSDSDPANPQNWGWWRKLGCCCIIYYYTLAVYAGSSIYAPAYPYVEQEFGVSIEVAALGLALYVLGYGISPMIFSPLSEIPAVGRNLPYIITFGLFVILCVPTALIQNVAGLLILRFLLGWFGGPCLATGPASLGDVIVQTNVAYYTNVWALAATGGPALAPLISGFSIPVKGWRWSAWELLWLASPAFVIMFLFLPETSASNILYRRAQRLRKLTGNNMIRSAPELRQLSPRRLAFEALIRPWQIAVLVPSIGFAHVYSGLLYCIFYSFFEAFPITFSELHGFNAGQEGLAFLSLMVACLCCFFPYSAWLYFDMGAKFRAGIFPPPERWLLPGVVMTICGPVGLFIFAWTSRRDIYWFVPVVGVFIFICGMYACIMSILSYLPVSYPQYAASIFAGNNVFRGAFAFASVLFSSPMYRNIGVGNGVSILASLTAVCCFGIWILYFYGENLRARSRFSG